jgi:hypothetical protein
MLDAGYSMPAGTTSGAGNNRTKARRHRCPFGDSVIGYWVLIGDRCLVIGY